VSGARRLREIGRFTAVAFLVTLILVPVLGRRTPAQAAAVPPLVNLQGEGSYDPMGEMTSWYDDLYGTSQTGLVSLNYLPTGGFQARQDLLAGTVDYALSGVAFTSAELGRIQGGAAGIIDAPVQVAAMGFLYAPPAPSILFPSGFGLIRQTGDPSNAPCSLPAGVAVTSPLWDAADCLLYVPQSSSVRVPHKDLAAMLTQCSAPCGDYGFDNPDVLTALGEDPAQGSDFLPPIAVPSGISALPTSMLRSEPSETDYYLQQYAQIAAPSVWTSLQSPNRTFPTQSEALPALSAQTRPGVDQVAGWLEVPPASGNVMAPMPPYGLSKVRSEALTLLPKGKSEANYQWIQIQNANGDWVAPTPDSITRAAAAGANTPLAALTTKVPGAYPLTWITHLYAPAHGLSIGKTEALATAIRYLATAGQTYTAAVGDGTLPAPLVKQAIAAANQLVLSNCPAANTVTSASPGPYAPPALAQANLGSMLHCYDATTDPAPTTTTTAAPTTTTSTVVRTTTTGVVTTTTVVSSPSGGSSSASGSSTGTAAGSTSVATTTTSTQTTGGGSTGKGPAPPGASTATSQPRSVTGTGALIVSSLPLPTPWSGRSRWNQLMGPVIGVGLVLLLRKPVGHLIQSIS